MANDKSHHIDRILGMEFETMDEAKGYFKAFAGREARDRELSLLATRVRKVKRADTTIIIGIDTSEAQKQLRAIEDALAALLAMHEDGTLATLKIIEAKR